MTVMRKKIWPEFFQLVLDGKKKCELRLADFECKPGDILVLEEWNPKTSRYTDRKIEKKVTHVVKTKNVKFWPKEDIGKFGFQMISIE